MSESSKNYQGFIKVKDNQLIIKFKYNKRRFNVLTKIGKANFNSKEKQWYLPIIYLSQLEQSNAFLDKDINYDFDYQKASKKIESELEKLKLANKAISENPFSVSEEYIALADLDVVFRFNKFQTYILASFKFGTKAKKSFKDIPGVYQINSEKAYYIPVLRLSEIVKLLRDKKFKFAIEANLGTRLSNTSEKRLKICENNNASSKELKDCLLVPLVSKKNNKFTFEAYTTQELKKCFLDIDSFSERKKQASGFDFKNLLKLLENARKNSMKIWLSKEVQEALNVTKKLYLSEFEKNYDNFSDKILNLITPEVCWLNIELSGGGILINKELYQTNESQLKLKEDFVLTHLTNFPKHHFFKIRDSKLVKSYDKYNKLFEDIFNVSIPKAKSFHSLINSLKDRAKSLLLNQKYQGLKDSKCNIKNTLLREKLFAHQRVAIDWLLETKEAFLGDDMGLGKTLSVLASFEELKSNNEVDILLVICPNSLVRNWIREANFWLDDLDLTMLPGSKPEKIKFLEELNFSKFSGLSINYESLRLEYVYPVIIELCKSQRVMLCIDESQRVKNPNSKSFKILDQIAPLCRRKVLLTGTPTPKDISDIWSQMKILDNGERLGDNYYEWLENIAELGNKWSKYAIKKFHKHEVEECIERVREVLLRRRKEEVLDLPEKIFSIRDVVLKGDQLKRYEEIRKDLFLRISSASGKSFVRQIDNFLELYLRAVQAASNPRLIDKNWNGDPAKFKELDNIVEELVIEGDQKLVVWTNYLGNIHELLGRYPDIRTAAFSGEVSTSERDSIIKDFQSDSKNSLKILLAIPAAGGVGITLTSAQTAVYLDKTWNAEHWLQSIDRIHRIGQQGTVNIISLNACPVDDLILNSLNRKTKSQSVLLGDLENQILVSKDELIQAVQN